MSQRRSRLASRFRKAVEDEESTERRDRDAAARAAEAAVVARTELLAELEVLGRDIGFLTVQREGGGLTLRYRERYLHFAPEGAADLKVEFEGTGDDELRLYRQLELGNRWVYLRRRRRREDRLPLFDQGIEELMVTALGLPRPDDDAPEPTEGGRTL